MGMGMILFFDQLTRVLHSKNYIIAIRLNIIILIIVLMHFRS